jgi:hypothetical protein
MRRSESWRDWLVLKFSTRQRSLPYASSEKRSALATSWGSIRSAKSAWHRLSPTLHDRRQTRVNRDSSRLEKADECIPRSETIRFNVIQGREQVSGGTKCVFHLFHVERRSHLGSESFDLKNSSGLSRLKTWVGKLSCTTLRVVIPTTRSVVQLRGYPKSNAGQSTG